MIKNIGVGVSAGLTQEKKQVEEGEVEGEKYTRMENETVFRLREDQSCRISAVAVWGENARGEILGAPPDIYFRHILTGNLCKSVWACLIGVVYDEYSEEKWDTLTFRIGTMLISDLQQIVCNEKMRIIYKKKNKKTTMQKQYNARGEKIYKNAINRENAKKIRK